MTKVYSLPSEFVKPCISDFIKGGHFDAEGFDKAENDYVKSITVHYLEKRPKGKNVGEVIKFPVADSYAYYMVACMKPLELIHLPLGDEWDCSTVDYVTAPQVEKMIENEKRFK